MPEYTFAEYLIIILIGLLFFKEEIIPWIKQKLGFNSDKTNATKGQVDQLAEYVNHRQTEILDAQTRILGDVKEGVEDIKRKHEEWDKFGVPIRNSNK